MVFLFSSNGWFQTLNSKSGVASTSIAIDLDRTGSAVRLRAIQNVSSLCILTIASNTSDTKTSLPDLYDLKSILKLKYRYLKKGSETTWTYKTMTDSWAASLRSLLV